MFVWIILLLVNMVATQENRCHGPSTCAECLQASKDCYWCEDHGFAFSRCNYKHILQSAAQQCNKTMNEDSRIVKRKTDRQTPFTSTVQVYPQELSIKLRPSQPHTFRVSVKPAKDYPVQIYFLMDLSSSMQDDLNNLKFLGTKIANKIRTLTQNYQLAFGSFVDKGLPPFVQPENKDKPCISCAPLFGYRHSFDFDKNATKFEEAVAKQVVSGNMDLPEGGFDGLMQVAVCEKMVGWRDSDITRRIVIFVTDASSHIAGDGKIGGVVMPNDGKCHMIADPKDPTVKNYDMSIKMDYPSIAHLGIKLKEAKIVPILAVTSRHAQLYESIARAWSESGASVGVLDENSSNMADLLERSYKAISTRVRLSANSSPYIEVKYKASCTTDHPNECRGVKVEEQVDFDVTLNLFQCPDNRRNESFTINIPGFGEVRVNVEFACECKCEKDIRMAHAPECTGNGTLKCGVCYCDSGRYGQQCECDGNNARDDLAACYANNSTVGDQEECNARGQCVCGKCVCKQPEKAGERIFGKYCQCGCETFNGHPCGGIERGRCDCDKCVCKEEFFGTNCAHVNCTQGEKKCTSKDGSICSGNGRCNCDRCDCNFGYKGDHCENCVYCPTKCEDVRTCVQCQVFKKGGDACERCNLNIELVNKTEERCSYLDGECHVVYSFKNDIWLGTANETVLVQRDKRCRKAAKPPVLPIVLGTIGGVLLLGFLALFTWKVSITAYDKFEYNQFEKERLKASWQKADNPIYNPSQREYQNPTYSGNL